MASINITEISEIQDQPGKEKPSTKTPKSGKRKFSKKYAFSVVMANQEWLIYASHAEEKRSWMNDLILLVLLYRCIKDRFIAEVFDLIY